MQRTFAVMIGAAAIAVFCVGLFGATLMVSAVIMHATAFRGANEVELTWRFGFFGFVLATIAGWPLLLVLAVGMLRRARRESYRVAPALLAFLLNPFSLPFVWHRVMWRRAA